MPKDREITWKIRFIRWHFPWNDGFIAQFREFAALMPNSVTSLKKWHIPWKWPWFRDHGSLQALITWTIPICRNIMEIERSPSTCKDRASHCTRTGRPAHPSPPGADWDVRAYQCSCEQEVWMGNSKILNNYLSVVSPTCVCNFTYHIVPNKRTLCIDKHLDELRSRRWF